MELLSNNQNLNNDRIIKKPDFQPYAENGGNTVAIAGDCFIVAASDTRLSSGYEILTRNQTKLFKITDKVILGSTGCWCDVLAFTRLLETRAQMYRYEHNQELTVHTAANLVSIMLYNRRFFPYYVRNFIAGLDENGESHIYRYDPVGSIEALKSVAGGSAEALLIPFLDNQLKKEHVENVKPEDLKISLEDAVKICKDALTSATEREITCGDAAHIIILTKDGIKEERMEMRKD